MTNPNPNIDERREYVYQFVIDNKNSFPPSHKELQAMCDLFGCSISAILNDIRVVRTSSYEYDRLKPSQNERRKQRRERVNQYILERLASTQCIAFGVSTFASLAEELGCSPSTCYEDASKLFREMKLHCSCEICRRRREESERRAIAKKKYSQETSRPYCKMFFKSLIAHERKQQWMLGG